MPLLGPKEKTTGTAKKQKTQKNKKTKRHIAQNCVDKKRPILGDDCQGPPFHISQGRF